MTVPEYVYRQCVKAGMTPEGACAVLGNLQAESAFIPNNVEDRSGINDATYTANVDNGTYTNFVYDAYGYGLAQWTFYTRKQLLLNYAKARNKSVGDLEMQVEFLIWEMKNYYSPIWKELASSTDLYQLTWKLLDKWENPAEKTNNMRVRYAYAQGWYEKFNGLDVDSDASEPAKSEQDALNEETFPTTDGSVDTSSSGNHSEGEATVLDNSEVHWPPRTIDKNMKGRDVKLLEALLYNRGYNVLIDGIFEKSLEDKVKEYQTANGLKADGVVGPKTWRSLMTLPSNF